LPWRAPPWRGHANVADRARGPSVAASMGRLLSAQSQTHLLLHTPCFSQITVGLHDSSRRGGGEATTVTQRSRTGGPQPGRMSRELLHIGCTTPLMSSQKHAAWLARGRESVREAVMSAWEIRPIRYMPFPLFLARMRFRCATFSGR
jgi:hypothetical protein